MIVMGLGEIGPDLKGAAKCSESVVGFALIDERVAEIVQGLDESGVDLQGGAESGGGLVKLAEAPQSVAEIEVRSA